MIAYAVGEKTVCGRPMESGTKALVATPAGARSMIAVPLLNRMKMADGAFDWDGYALVGIAPGLYKNETGGRREGSCAVRWQSLQENFPATCWRRIQVWVRRDSKAKADWRQRGP